MEEIEEGKEKSEGQGEAGLGLGRGSEKLSCKCNFVSELHFGVENSTQARRQNVGQTKIKQGE